jgi:acyl carrier protein
MISKPAIADKILAALAKESKRDVSSLSLDQTLMGDLGLTSLDALELVFKLEGEFNLSIPDEDMEKLVTVRDTINYVESRLS